MLDELRRRLQTHTPPGPQGGRPEAAVLVPLLATPEPQLLLTQRAARLSTHSGEVAFPGGRRDPEDDSLIVTALRESWEEVGLARSEVEVIGQLTARESLHGLQVTPVVGLLPPAPQLLANPDEIAAIFTVPLRFFADSRFEVLPRVDYQGRQWQIPCYHYAGYRIWGLTAMMVVELVNLVYDAGIELRMPVQRS